MEAQGTRRVTALLARLMNGLQSIKPSWLDGSRPGGPSLAEALPLRPSRVEAPLTSGWSGGLMKNGLATTCVHELVEDSAPDIGDPMFSQVESHGDHLGFSIGH